MAACHNDAAALTVTFNTHSVHISVQHSLRKKRRGRSEMQGFSVKLQISFNIYCMLCTQGQKRDKKRKNYKRNRKKHTHISSVRARSTTFWKCISIQNSVIWFNTFHYNSVQTQNSILMMEKSSVLYIRRIFPSMSIRMGYRPVLAGVIFTDGKIWWNISRRRHMQSRKEKKKNHDMTDSDETKIPEIITLRHLPVSNQSNPNSA